MDRDTGSLLKTDQSFKKPVALYNKILLLKLHLFKITKTTRLSQIHTKRRCIKADINFVIIVFNAL